MKSTSRTALTSAKLAAAITIGMMAAPNTASAQEYYIGQLVPGGYNFCPRNSIAANGQLLAISSNTALFSLLGTNFGGDGRTTFGMPDLRGRAPIHHGNGPGLSSRPLGQKSGAETVVMTTAQLPSHNHTIGSKNVAGDKGGPASDFPAASNIRGQKNYHNGPADALMDSAMVQPTGGGQAIHIMNPFIAIQWCVATFGIYPSRN